MTVFIMASWVGWGGGGWGGRGVVRGPSFGPTGAHLDASSPHRKLKKMGFTEYASSWMSELRVLYNLAVKPVKGDTHKARLESFYGHQAFDYDAFRKRLLTGREELMTDVAARAGGKGGVWVDMGGGTGANLEMMGDEAVMSFAKVYIVDLCGPLLEMARKRCEEHGWHNVEVVEADATTWEPEEGFGQVDLVTFSYSLTMIPDWCAHATARPQHPPVSQSWTTHAPPRARSDPNTRPRPRRYGAIDHATTLLCEGGLLGVADFYVARKHPPAEMAANTWLQRTFWPAWFAMDDVRLNPDHLPYIQSKFDQVQLDENAAMVPYIGYVLPKVPVYRFLGTVKKTTARLPSEPYFSLPALSHVFLAKIKPKSKQ